MSEPRLKVVDFDDIYEELMESDEPLEDSDDCLEYLENSPAPYTQEWMKKSKSDPDVLEDIMKIIECYLERPIDDDD